MASEVRPDGPLSVDQTGALIAELLSQTPGGRLGQGEIADALAAIGELYASAATSELWRDGRIQFGWDTDDEQLVICGATQTDADQVGRLIFGGN
jgi:hypothetical protein